MFAALVLLAAAAIAPDWLARTAGAAATTDQPTAPARLHDPWFWQATVGERPAGPATVLFFTDRTRYFESTGVMVGRTGGYRLLPVDVGEGQGVLSPDGRLYLRPGSGVVVDLATGEERRSGPTGFRPLAWSPRDGELLGTRDNDDTVVTYGPDNQPVNDPAHPDDLLAVDLHTARTRVVPAGTFASHAAASWSPDGRLIVVAGAVGPGDGDRQRVTVVDPWTGAVRWSRDLAGGYRLGGRAAWSPDGGRIALLGYEGCAGDACPPESVAARQWRIGYLDALTGAPLGSAVPLDGWPKEVVGWRAGTEPVLTRVPEGEVRVGGSHLVVVAVRSDGRSETLVDSPAGVTGIELPDVVLAQSAFGGGDHRPSVFAAPLWAYLLVAAPPLVLVGWLVRRRRTARSAGATLPTGVGAGAGVAPPATATLTGAGAGAGAATLTGAGAGSTQPTADAPPAG
ncbi:hypothetical protein [Micromonospora echinofusca]|uniref:WD40-like Beta Propeller Repeat n=1 Tax=Micromonospora echinofusca TaxID=47858 RepID=A0ABS3VLL9_MICEH|nr:hypothetical protein [Micromonospora echinofusca]MBO4205415.1 hypothetical protein [Micromonospora echinofusca]